MERLNSRLELALRVGSEALDELVGATPIDERDALLTLATIHDLHLAPLERVGASVQHQHHPAVVDLKRRIERAQLDALPTGSSGSVDAVLELRRIARTDAVPEVYQWLAERASWDELVEFLALEGGPDANFDDLVALCQVGLAGEAKMELARNYWDEMGQGSPERVHTELHRKLCRAVELPAVPRRVQPLSGLRRTALGNILATNRALQPELVGALGLLELQAGPRSRKVVAAMARLGAGPDASDFYEEHAQVDPHHGKAWVDHVVAPLARDGEWAQRMVRGARWRSAVNGRFFDDLAARFMGGSAAGALRASA